MLSSNKKIIILFIIGFALIGYGIFRISTAYIESDSTVSQYGFNITSKPDMVKFHTNVPKNEASSFESFNIDLTAADVFSVGNPISYDIQTNLKESNDIKSLYVVIRKSNNIITGVNNNTFHEFIDTEKSLNNLIEVFPISTTEFHVSDVKKFDHEGEYGFSILSNSTKFGIEIIDLSGDTLIVKPSVEKTNIDAIRSNITSTIFQLRSSLIVEGFSAIIVGWIPLEFGIHHRKENLKEKNEKRKSTDALLAELNDVPIYLKKRKKPSIEIVDKHIETHTSRFSTYGFNNFMIQGTYQELNQSEQTKLSELYLHFNILNDLTSQIAQLLFLGDVENTLFGKRVKSLNDAYEKQIAEIEKQIPSVVTSLQNYRLSI